MKGKLLAGLILGLSTIAIGSTVSPAMAQNQQQMQQLMQQYAHNMAVHQQLAAQMQASEQRALAVQHKGWLQSIGALPPDNPNYLDIDEFEVVPPLSPAEVRDLQLRQRLGSRYWTGW